MVFRLKFSYTGPNLKLGDEKVRFAEYVQKAQFDDSADSRWNLIILFKLLALGSVSYVEAL
jgi:hypothetical protein